MGLYINGNPLAKGVQHFLDSIQIKEIYYRHGRNSAFTLYYQYDSVAPTINISSASTGYSPTQTYELTGSIIDTESGVASAYYTHNDDTQHPLTIASDGSFSTSLVLEDGANDISVSATDNAGNTNVRNITLIYDNSAHASTLNSLIVIRTDYRVDYSWSYAHRETQRKDVQNLYVSQYTSSQCSGNGQYVQSKAWYYGRINVDSLPNWQYIKRIVINRYGSGLQTFNLDGTQTTLSFSDYDESHTDAHDVGTYASVTAKAGISSLTYYYT